MQKKPTKVKTLRLRKEALKTLTTDQLLRVHAGDAADPWDPPTGIFPLCVAPDA